jgi:hypothetical protein
VDSLAEFAAFAEPGWVKYPYWVLIRLGSGLIRREMLAAVDRAARATDGRG